ncbi:TonB-dependent receptor plug domain-containing protein [Maricaulis sp.]|uniref:TonB-dependent receptor plug domain-containing protein n=1 Tax=Maricaulis sp. TaxID=1486257 RepID=UPI003A90520B
MRDFLTSAIAGTACLATLGTPAWAVIQAETVAGESLEADSQDGRSIFSKAYFDAFSPVTALDMVQRIPGFSLSDGDTSRRGLGDSFGNVLINGTRPSNKSLSLDTVLQRIPIADVAQLELIQEALPEYNMRGHSRLVNIILVEGAGNSGSFDARLRMSPSGRLGPRGIISYATVAGPVELSFGLDVGTEGNRIHRRRTLLDASDTLVEIQRDNDQRQYREAEPSFSLNWQIDDRSSLRFDLQGTVWDWKRTQVSFIDAPSGSGHVPLRYEQNATSNHGNSYLGSVSYARELSPTISIQTMALLDRETWDDGPEAYETYDPVSGFVDAIIVEANGETEETALRQTLAWTPDERHAFEFGAEIAVNARATGLALFEDDGVTVTPIVLPVANTRVEETRSEIFVNHTWTVSDRLSLESGLRYEFSEIVQTGDSEQSRSFAYPKPSLTLNWRQDEHNRLRLTARRDVDQLDFGKFASSIDIADNNATLGNPDYVPQRTWTLEAEWERRFGDDGSASLQVGYDWIEDLDGWVPITTPTGVFDAPGNIGDGTNLRVTVNLTTPLDRFGLSNAVIDVFGEWYNTNVEDPLTGQDRAFSGNREWELGLDYRQTFPAQQLAWGWDYHWVSDGEVYRAQEFRLYDNTDGDLDLYIETTRWGGVTTRLGVDAVLNTGDKRERVFYDGSRAAGLVTNTEYRTESSGSIWYLRVRGTF